ncbi:GNAT family N-acetyltransferase [Cohnella panacarvi]|uniref:GNAT family N-acetyltransferase n=1 Tax=Cohnella panacarvi TaxID=400776 RepID=UPI00047BBBFB
MALWLWLYTSITRGWKSCQSNEEHRDRGIGKALIERLTDRAKQAGCRRIELDSGFHREQAHRTYEHVGFDKRAFLFSKEIV